MSYSGGLIFPFLAEIGRLDTHATGAPVQGFASGYDRVFRQPRNLPNQNQAGKTSRVETLLRLRCQVEGEENERAAQGAAGNVPVSLFKLVVHAEDLDDAGLRDAEGNVLLDQQDRLVRVLTTDEVPQWKFPSPPGLYLQEILPGEDVGLALVAPRIEIFVLTFRSRDVGAK